MAELPLPPGAPWLTEKKAVLRDAGRFQALFERGDGRCTAFLTEADVPDRPGERPVTRDVPPQQMYTQQAPPAVLERLIEAALALSRDFGTVVEPTKVSFPTTKPAFHIRTPLASGLHQYAREHAHIHATWAPGQPHAEEGVGGGSMHIVVSHADARLLILRGWAEWHPVAAEELPMVLLYAPRNDAEVAVLLAVLRASHRFVSGG
eukprot:NODE_21056_length_770_cov_13.836703.p1 GENE.NODE_21056_length_770_cov_13.836703~~NODE_21056_length_770_cov_13.836703.p1  ORF type:complete len:227 (+),score=69.67 NODE_21056_length_770_cov_13.836703:66-683(+)